MTALRFSPDFIENRNAKFCEEIALSQKTFTYNSIQLLPSNYNSLKTTLELNAHLSVYKSFLKLAAQALAMFENNQVEEFNPLLGNNACQTTTTLFFEISKKRHINEEVESAALLVKSCLTQTSSLLHKKHIHQSFQDLTTKNNAAFDISEDIFFIVSSHILTLSKRIFYEKSALGIEERNEKTDATKLVGYGFNKNLSSKLINRLKKKLSALTVRYIQRLAFNSLLEKHFDFVFGKNIIRDHLKISYTHVFHSMPYLIESMKRLKQPIIVKVNQFQKGNPKCYSELVFHFQNNSKNQFQLTRPSRWNPKKNAIVIQFNSMTEEPLSEKNIRKKFDSLEEALILNSAAHTTHGLKDNDSLDDLCKFKREEAIQKGFSRKNPECIIEHFMTGSEENDFLKILQQTLRVTSTTKVNDLFSIIAKNADLDIQNLRLIAGNRSLSMLNNQNTTLADAGLSAETPVYAVMSNQTYLHPNRKFTLNFI